MESRSLVVLASTTMIEGRPRGIEKSRHRPGTGADMSGCGPVVIEQGVMPDQLKSPERVQRVTMQPPPGGLQSLGSQPVMGFPKPVSGTSPAQSW